MKTGTRTDQAADPDTRSDRAEQVAAQAQADQGLTPQFPAAAGTVIACLARARARLVSCGRRVDAWMPFRLLTASGPAGTPASR
jgi:hypothetical protein